MWSAAVALPLPLWFSCFSFGCSCFLTASQETKGKTKRWRITERINGRSLIPGDHPRLGSTRFEDWLSHNAQPVAPAVGGGK
jgi:hypothetical protein